MLAVNILVFALLFVLLSRKINKLKLAKTPSTKVNYFMRKLINKKEEM
jgi:hypothetical protein